MLKRKEIISFGGLGALIILLFLLNLLAGSVHIPASDIFSIIGG